MTIDWPNFTPWFSLLGGVFIGVASGLFILFNGRIAGISGILGGMRPVNSVKPPSPARDDVAFFPRGDVNLWKCAR